MRDEYDVVIAGAGPAGSAAAALLAGRGARVALLERAAFPRAKPCAEYLSPDAVALLERLGVADAVRRAGAAVVRGIRLVAPDGTETTGRFPDRPGLALPRARLDTLLAHHAAARGADLRTGSAVTGCERHDAGWTVHVQRPAGAATVRAALLIGADGLHSRVARATVGIRPPTSRRIALVTHYAGVPGMREAGEMHVTPFGYVGLAPVGGGTVNVSVVVDRGRERPPANATAWLHTLVSRIPEVADRLAGGRRVDRVRGVGPFGRRARRAAGRRLLLVGDAAEFFDPFTGDGIWAALTGANLAAAAAETPDALGGYVRARRAAFAGKWLVERMVAAAVARPRLFSYVARRLARRHGLTDTLVGVTGHVLPPSRALDPRFLLALAR